MNTRNYFMLVGLHAIIGILIYLVPFVSKIYAILILIVGLLWVIRNKNLNNEILYVCAYLIGVEVFLRMTKGNPGYEFVKYAVMFFSVLGMYMSGISKNATAYWIFLLLMLPGVIIGTQVLEYDTSVRKSIMFNISGPVGLVLTSLYCYRRKISLNELNNIMLFIGLPVISLTVYLMLFTPNLRDTITGTHSNFETSGGFGPNQVATILGLGMFVFFARTMYFSKNKLVFVFNVIITLLIAFRGLVTFSRGGMITAAIMIVFIIVVSFLRINNNAKLKVGRFIVLIGFTLLCTWIYTGIITGGLISKRYANQDSLGRVKESQLSGREVLLRTELELFLENPFWGGGVGKGKEHRLETTGIVAASHNEMTRMLGEHGFFGILGLLLLMMVPIILYIDNREHIFMFSFLIFWFLTLNHAAMRTAAPGFIYALSVLKITLYGKKDTLHWKQIISIRKKSNSN